jgi:hypothetical protein
LETTLVSFFNIHNEALIGLVCELMSNWAVHANCEIRPLFEFACAVHFEVLLASVGFALKEKTLHALRQTVTRLSPSEVLKVVDFETFTHIVDILVSSDPDTPIAYEACACTYAVVGAAQGNGEAMEVLHRALGTSEVREHLTALAGGKSADVGRAAGMLLAWLERMDNA